MRLVNDSREAPNLSLVYWPPFDEARGVLPQRAFLVATHDQSDEICLVDRIIAPQKRPKHPEAGANVFFGIPCFDWTQAAWFGHTRLHWDTVGFNWKRLAYIACFRPELDALGLSWTRTLKLDAFGQWYLGVTAS